MLLMLLGVVALCQPWSLLVHSYSATIILLGLVLFNIFSRIGSPPAQHRARDGARTGAPPAH
jgi:hypothetical protein